MEKQLEKIKRIKENKQYTFVAVMFGCAIVGVLTLIFTGAAGFSNIIEPEAGSINNIEVASSSSASGGKYVMFGKGRACSPIEHQSCSEQNSNGTYFKEAFNNNPPAPLSVMNRMDLLPRWFAQPAMQGTYGWDFKPEPMLAQHGSDCGMPSAWSGGPWNGVDVPMGFHKITTYEDSVYMCRDHIMTALNPPSGGPASAVTVLKPNHLVDLSKGEAVVRIDVSTLSPSLGDWWEVWLTPWNEQLVSPTDHWFHHAGSPKTAAFFKVEDFTTKKHWQGKFFDNYNFAGGVMDIWNAPDIRPIVAVSNTRRDTYEIRITDSKVKMLVENFNTGNMDLVAEYNFPRSKFLGNEAVVQFTQSSYEPEMHSKFGCAADPCPITTIPATWHWDNAEIFPAKEYKIIGTKEYQIWYGSESKKITFNEPIPDNARLLYNGFSNNNVMEVSFDNGATYKKATTVRGPNGPERAAAGLEPDFLTYTIDVPSGATSALIKGDGGYPGNPNPFDSWSAQNFHVIAK